VLAWGVQRLRERDSHWVGRFNRGGFVRTATIRLILVLNPSSPFDTPTRPGRLTRGLTIIVGATLLLASGACQDRELAAGPGTSVPPSYALVTVTGTQNLFGTVQDVRAHPLSGIHVSSFDALNGELIGNATTTSDGTYDSGFMPVGTYRVRFSDPDGTGSPGFYRPAFFGAGGTDGFCAGSVVSIIASTTAIVDETMTHSEPTLVVTFSGAVEGTVVDAANSAPIPDIRVTLRRADNAEQVAVTTTDLRGKYRVALKELRTPTVRVRFSDPSAAFSPAYFGKPVADAFCDAVAVAFEGGVTGIDVLLNRTPPEALTQTLVEAIASLALPDDVQAMLVTPLDRVLARAMAT
jgi:hypothetical protein